MPSGACGGMDLAKLKARYGRQIVFNGAIDSHHVLIEGTPESVRQQTRKALAIMMPGGGYCFAPTHSLQDNSPTENVVAMYEAAKRYGRY